MASILKVDTIQDQDGNNIINESGDTITIGASGDTITVPTGATLDLSNATQTGVGGTNTPAFHVGMSANQSVSEGTDTLLQFDTEIFDTNSAFNNTASGNGYSFTVPSGEGGKYVIYASIQASAGTSNMEFAYLFPYVNGSNTIGGSYLVDCRDNEQSNLVLYRNVIFNLSENDYVQIYVKFGTANSGNVSVKYGTATRKDTVFGGYKLIGV